MAGDIERWITVNGIHIPIIKGESRARAVANFIKGKREKRVKTGVNELKQKNWTKAEAEDAIKTAIRWSRPDIKGRAKTKEAKYDQINDEYNKEVAEAQKRTSGYSKDWDEYGKKLHEYNKALSQAEKTREQKLISNRIFKKDTYKLKTDTETPKRTIKGVGKTAKANKTEKEAIAADYRLNKLNRWDYTNKAKYEKEYKKRNQESNKAWGNYERATTFKMTDANRQKMIRNQVDKVTKLDRQVENAKTTPEFRRLQKKQEKAQKVINALGGKYIVGRKKK